MSDEGDLRIVLETNDPVELAMVRNLLEEADIRCAVNTGSAAAAMNAILGAGYAGLQTLLVSVTDEERALDLLDAAFEADPRDAAGDEDAPQR